MSFKGCQQQFKKTFGFNRSFKILKNSYSSDDVQIGLAFQPLVGTFKEMPRLFETTEQVYDNIANGNYFLLP